MKIRNLLLSISILIVFGQHTYSQCVQTIWEDNFDGTSLNTGLWNYDLGDGSGTPAGAGWGNGELQSYTNSASNIKVQDGKLIITALYDGAYTSAKIKSTASADGFLKFGRIEARMKLPSATGAWPAFWMMPKSGAWPDAGEIDILEASHLNPSKSQSTVIYANPASVANYTTANHPTPDLSADFHVYAMEWSENQIRFFFDDEMYFEVNPELTAGNKWPFNSEFYLILNVAVGGPSTGYTGMIPPVPAEFPTSLEVDYVKVSGGTWTTYIAGASSIYQNSTKTYSISSIPDATYEWTIPGDATLVSGQGTNSINVQYDNTLTGEITCTLTNSCGANIYKKDVIVEEEFEVVKIYEDFESNRNVTYGTPTGTLLQVIDNPASNDVNPSTKVGKYTRNATELYDVLPIENVSVEQAGLYVTSQRRIHLDVYTAAPIGTKLRIQFENSSISTGDNYPYGRHSVYEVLTTTQNEWETLEFEYTVSPDINMLASGIDLFTLLVDPENNTNHAIWFDNLQFGQAGADKEFSITDVFEDYDGTSQMTKKESSGTYSIVANPSSDAVNSSANCLKYTRSSADQYDVLSFNNLVGITDASVYKNGDKSFFIDIYTDAPIGTAVLIQLENSSLSTAANYPVGRNSKYEAVTGAQNQWHTIQFSFAATIDLGTPDVAVDQFVILLDPGNNSGNIYYIDNIQAGTTSTNPVIWTLDNVYEDFDGTSLLTYASANGTYDGKVANPFPGGINTSANVGQYTRSASHSYDALFFDNVSIGDASLFRNGERRFALDVYTAAPAGTLVNVQLENKNTSTPDNYPTGRHSYYQGVVKAQNEWHTIDFVYTASPDVSISNENVNTTTFLFAPNSSTNYRVYFDNFRSYIETTDPNAPMLSLSAKSLTIAAAANSTKTFDIASSNTKWTVSSDQDWLVVTSPTDTSNATITLTAEENLSVIKRTAVLTVTASGLSNQTVTVVQDGAPDLEAPTAFTATTGTVTFTSIELNLNANDNSGFIDYTVSYGETVLATSGSSGVQKSFIVTGLTSATDYIFSVVAKDASGNTADNSPILVSVTIPADLEAPSAFTVSNGGVTSNSVVLLLQATDNSGLVIFTINYGGTTINTQGSSGVQKSYTIGGLSAETSYSFSVTAEDAAGNSAANNPVTVSATTAANVQHSYLFIDYETVGQDWTWTTFENGPDSQTLYSIGQNPDPNGINLSPTCAKYIVNSDGAPWAGVESKHGTDLGPLTFTSSNSTIKIMVYKSVLSDVGIKFADPSGWSAGELKVRNTKINEWEELTFDFSPRIGQQVCDQIIVFPDFSNPRTAGSTNYWDNISFTGPTTSIKDKFENSISLYPNPVSNKLHIGNINGDAIISIYDINGRQLFNKTSYSTTEIIDVADFAKGVYIIKISGVIAVKTSRFIKL